MNGRIVNGKINIELEDGEAALVVKEFDSIPNTRDSQTSLKGTTIFPTRIPNLNNMVKYVSVMLSTKGRK